MQLQGTGQRERRRSGEEPEITAVHFPAAIVVASERSCASACTGLRVIHGHSASSYSSRAIACPGQHQGQLED
jgi:hypothetical protein